MKLLQIIPDWIVFLIFGIKPFLSKDVQTSAGTRYHPCGAPIFTFCLFVAVVAAAFCFLFHMIIWTESYDWPGHSRAFLSLTIKSSWVVLMFCLGSFRIVLKLHVCVGTLFTVTVAKLNLKFEPFKLTSQLKTLKHVMMMMTSMSYWRVNTTKSMWLTVQRRPVTSTLRRKWVKILETPSLPIWFIIIFTSLEWHSTFNH